MEYALVWAVVLLAAGLAFVLLEMFVPSGGVLGVLAALAIVGSIVMAFLHHNTYVGIGFAVVEVIGISALVAGLLKWWPDSAIGRRIVPQLLTGEEVLPDNEQVQALRQLLGKVGTARCLMLPSGAISIEGRVVNALSEGMAIEAGTRVRVIEVRGNRVVVRPVQDEPPPRRDPNDVLSRPLDELGLDSLDEPFS
ncbi:MAG: NfeD family protein [Pirellulales bacterium]